jgi:hypothetical protein
VFGFSNNAVVHERRRGLGATARRLGAGIGRGPRGLDEPAWLGAAVDLDRLHEVAAASGLAVERIVGQGTQYCVVSARRGQPQPQP